MEILRAVEEKNWGLQKMRVGERFYQLEMIDSEIDSEIACSRMDLSPPRGPAIDHS